MKTERLVPFKNILCYCSTVSQIMAAQETTYLKTSYVIVQHGIALGVNTKPANLKTSYVIVQRRIHFPGQD